jgi:hypothetical protein
MTTPAWNWRPDQPEAPAEPTDAQLGAALRVRLAEVVQRIAANEREIIAAGRNLEIAAEQRHENLRVLQRERTRLQDDAIALGSVVELARQRLERGEGH